MADFEEAGDDDVFRKVRKDFDAKRRRATDQEIRRIMAELMGKAVDRSRPAASAQRLDSGAMRSHQVRASSMASLPGFSLAARLRAGETVFTGWCGLPAPIVAEIVAREGFSAVTLDPQHGMWDVAGLAAGIAAVRQGGAAPIVRVPLGDFAMVSRVARFRRRRHHRADDQHRGRCARLRRGGEISRRSASAAGARTAPRCSPASPTRRTICAKPTTTSSRWR